MASSNMKLIQSIIFLIIIIGIDCQKFHQDQFPFPPQFQTLSPPILSSDSTIYLPPESSTSVPYFNMNNIKKLPVNYLPPTAMKVPQVYPTPYTPIFSSSRRPDFEDEEINNNNKLNIRRITIPASQTSKNVTITDKDMNLQKIDVKESRSIPITPNYQQRFVNNEKQEIKRPIQNVPGVPHFNIINQNPASRRMIVTSEIQRNENGLDQVKAASFANSQYLQPPGIFISSTIEPAIPILRLSNEMDLDGSFSYEALGADQTHYVQHSRMENMGTDKEEQVVEGSYSYVADNGQTYTVHYVADSNGYRASGDHLPVPPPIPEIIQRAVQYNLAEEAKKPPHLRQNWENEGIDFEPENTDHRYAITPLRNLFTGKTPEAFSLGFSQNAQNPLISAASSQSLVKTTYDVTKDQNKSMTNIASIAPQITFLASQGAHNPPILQQQTVPKIISNEKTTLPQIMNYEANTKDSDQEANKALWRWQYGVNANDNNQNPNKNTISRSFGEGDDIIINFGNMTPEQYTRMIQAQVLDQNTSGANNFVENSKDYTNQEKYNDYYKESKDTTLPDSFIKNDKLEISYENEIKDSNDTFGGSANNSLYLLQSTENPYTYANAQTEENKFYEKTNNNYFNQHSNIIKSQNFAPSPQMITQTYMFEEDTTYEPTKLKVNQEVSKNKTVTEIFPKNDQSSEHGFHFENGVATNKPMLSTFENVYISDFTQKQIEKNDFKPVTNMINYEDHFSTTTSTVTDSFKEVIKENFFLKNLLNNSKSSKNKTYNKINIERKEDIQSYNTETKLDKVSKLLEPPQKVQTEIKFSKKKPLDINDVLNFVAMKNQFEPAKTKAKIKPTVEYTQEFIQKEPSRYIPTTGFSNEENISRKTENLDNARIKDRQHHQDYSVVKNYKVLQRQKHTGQNSDLPQVQESYRKVISFPAQNLPPLGRAGPSLKTYLPPIYV